MSLENFSKVLYQDLPSRNLGFVEGGVLICPSMIGLTLPTDLQDRDLYIYMCLYNQLMKKLASASNEVMGKAIVNEASKELEVPKDAFEKNTGQIYMLECLIAKQIIPSSFENIQAIFRSQEKRSKDLLVDLEKEVDDIAKEIGSNLKKKVALPVDNVKENKESVPPAPPPNTSKTQTPPLPQEDYSSSNALVLGAPANPSNVPNTPQKTDAKDSGILSSAKSFATKPPVIIGGVVGAYFLLNKYVFAKDQKKRNPRKRKSKKGKYRS
jgi:hypothetical protein